MHPNPVFRKADVVRNVAFARERSFGTLAVNGAEAPLLSHVPFQLSEDGAYLEAHLVRSNPIATLLREPRDVVIAVQGGDTYISPDWYDMDDQVPTWNYVAVHLRGRMQLLPDADLRGILERLSRVMEERLVPKPIWLIDKVDDAALHRMLRMIVPVAMQVDSVDGTWKLSQNKPDGAGARAGQKAATDGIGQGLDQISGLMMDPPV